MERHWIYSPLKDSATILCGITLCLILVLLRPFSLEQNAGLWLLAASTTLGMLHSWSTTYLVVGSKMFAPLRKADPDRYIKIPAALFIGSLALGIMIAKLVNISDTGEVDFESALYYIYIAIFWVGHFWHFGRQDFGVLSLYRQRAGQASAFDRMIDNRFMQVMMYFVQPAVFFAAFTRSGFTTLVSWLSWGRLPFETLGLIAISVAFMLFACVVIIELRKPNRSYGKILYYVLMLFHPAFLYFSGPSMQFYWFASYLVSHWVIAITLAAKINVGYHVQQSKKPLVQTLVQHFAIVGIVSVAIVIAFSPFAGLSLLRGDFIDARENLRGLAPEQFLLAGIYFGFGLGEQLVHYYCDRCLFRFKDPAVRSLVTPHL